MKSIRINAPAMVICATLIVLGSANAEEAKPGPAAAPPPAAKLSKEQKALKKLKDEKDMLSAQNQVRAERLKAKLADMLEEKEELAAEYGLLQQKMKSELAKLEIEKARLDVTLALQAARIGENNAETLAKNAAIDLAIATARKQQEQELLKLSMEQARLAAEGALDAQRHSREVAEMTRKNAILKLENDRLMQQQAKQRMEMAMATARLAFEAAQLKGRQMAGAEKIAKLQADISLRAGKDEWRSEVAADIEYSEQPYKDGVLTISDRRIALNGAIMGGTADHVTERIHYFNNQSKKLPIFIVIDSSPGGSVMEGYRILKAMEASDAPIHVLVKSFAASMAAVITTAAEESYAYPNAILLHHQPSGGRHGNLTQWKEQAELFEEWARRLHKPIEKKLGLSREKFYAAMYKHNSMGDWEEFADEAAKLKWVGHVVAEVREEGIRKKPADEAPLPLFFFGQAGEKKPASAVYAVLPQPAPFDFYFMYNPNDYYRW